MIKNILLPVLLALLLGFAPIAQADSVLDISAMTAQELLDLRNILNDRLIEIGEYPFIQLERNDKGDEVVRVQERLQALGYLVGRITGKYDNETQKAMKAFEKANNLDNDGIASIADQRILFSNTATINEIIVPANTPKPEKAIDPEKAEYEQISYDDYARNPETYRMKKVLLKGRVEQVVGSREDGYQLRFSVLNNSSNIIYVLGIDDPGFNILDGDRMNIYATLYETVTYETIWGNKITIPACYANIVELLS